MLYVAENFSDISLHGSMGPSDNQLALVSIISWCGSSDKLSVMARLNDAHMHKQVYICYTASVVFIAPEEMTIGGKCSNYLTT